MAADAGHGERVQPPHDVRMRGFRQRADVEQVERFLTGVTGPLALEAVALRACAGRVLAEEIVAPIDVPGFRRAAMDGYAVRGEDTFGASEYAPVRLELLGQSLPGFPFEGRVASRQAVRIMTGAPLPDGADAVLMAEYSLEREGHVEVCQAVAPKKHVGNVGEDIARGERVLCAGRRLRPQDAALLSSIGVSELHCVRRPRVQLVITGDELLPAGSRPEGAHIVDSNSVLLEALVRRDGGELLAFEIHPDRPERIRAELARPGADVLLVSGGSSVGQEDHAPGLVAELGTLDFHGVSMRPSSPSGCGRIGGRLVFLLPGNPVSCLCAYEFFAGPSIRALGGRSRAWPHRRVRLRLARKIVSSIGRTDYVRVRLEAGEVVPIATAGAANLSSTVRAFGAVIVPRALEGVAEGEAVEVLLYDEDLA